MDKWCPIVGVLALMALSGCHKAPHHPDYADEIFQVRIVAVVEADWDSNNRTVVEFPCGERRQRRGIWGAVGDEFSARRYHTTYGGDTWR